MSDIHASYEIHHGGIVSITLDDPTFVRAESVLVNLASGEVSALLQQKIHSLGAAPSDIIELFRENRDVTLRAVRIDGSMLALRSEIVLVH